MGTMKLGPFAYLNRSIDILMHLRRPPRLLSSMTHDRGEENVIRNS